MLRNHITKGAPDPELCHPAGSGSMPDPDMSDPAGFGSEPDPAISPDMRPDPVHPYTLPYRLQLPVNNMNHITMLSLSLNVACPSQSDDCQDQSASSTSQMQTLYSNYQPTRHINHQLT